MFNFQVDFMVVPSCSPSDIIHCYRNYSIFNLYGWRMV